MSKLDPLFIVLAAGKGTRMASATPKVLHAIGGRSLLGHVVGAAREVENAKVAVVVGPGMEDVAAEARRHAPDARVFVQPQQRGTADAVLAARAAIAGHTGQVAVLYGDTPLIERRTPHNLCEIVMETNASVAVLGFDTPHPHGYGRLLIEDGGRLLAIREEKEATEEERRIRVCNSGVMAFRGDGLLGILDRIGNDNAKGEYYLTDAVEIARRHGGEAVVVMGEEEDVLGVNSREQLAAAEAIFQKRARRRAMEGGATLVAPETVWFSYDTAIGKDVTIEPNVFFGPGVAIEDEARILANCHIEGAVIRKGARIGPFARLRPGSDIGPDAHIGNFVEVKNVAVGAGAKANHLSYLGDGRVGAAANIGAGTIFCNYDGFFKHRTEIGDGAFIGSNSSLVAPVKIGAGAYVGSGSVITKDVAADALALERSPQEGRAGWAARFRALMGRRKNRTA